MGVVTEGSTTLSDPVGGLTVAGGTPPANIPNVTSNIVDDKVRLTLRLASMSEDAVCELFTIPFEPFSTAEHQTLMMYLRTSFPHHTLENIVSSLRTDRVIEEYMLSRTTMLVPSRQRIRIFIQRGTQKTIKRLPISTQPLLRRQDLLLQILKKQ